MEDKPNFACPHCKSDNWKKNETTLALMGIKPTGLDKGKPSGQYMETITYVCMKCGHIVFFRIP